MWVRDIRLCHFNLVGLIAAVPGFALWRTNQIGGSGDRAMMQYFQRPASAQMR